MGGLGRVWPRHPGRPATEAIARLGRRLSPPAPVGGGLCPTVVLGAGSAGSALVLAMLRSAGSPFLPVAVLDDDVRKRRWFVHGLAVRGGREALVDVVRETGARAVVIAVADADAAMIAEVLAGVAPMGVDVRVLPPLAELLQRPVAVQDLRPVTPADLLGRQELRLDLPTIAGYLRNRRVLVTGAGGSIGSELCRQVSAFLPARLVMLDRDESALHGTQLSMVGRAPLDDRDLVVADIRDEKRLSAVFAEHRPDVVFHAAALKHLPLLQMHPGEALETNVRGTLNVLRASAAWDVERLVNISTDKAADPISVLGYSKRIAERLSAWSANEEELSAISVRFGNVLGSRGSVLTTFREQIKRGGPVTVTHPDVTRYFMTVEEAVGLVVQAGAIGNPGEALVLDMGDPVRIVDVVERLLEEAGVRLEVEFTGLRRGEKLHEDLFGDDETDVRPVHSRVSHVPVPPLDPGVLAGLDQSMPHGDLVRAMRHLCAPVGRGGRHFDVRTAAERRSVSTPVAPVAL